MYKIKRFSLDTKQKVSLGLVGLGTAAGAALGARKALKKSSKDYENDKIKSINSWNEEVKDLSKMKKSKSDEYGNKISDKDMKYVDDELDFSKKRLEDEKKSLQYIKNNPKKYKAKKSLEKAGIGAISGLLATAGTMAVADKVSKVKLSNFIRK